jgi:hypothetical protein
MMMPLRLSPNRSFITAAPPICLADHSATEPWIGHCLRGMAAEFSPIQLSRDHHESGANLFYWANADRFFAR